VLGDKTCLVLCYQSILAARVKLLDLEKIVDRVIRFLEAAMAENLRRSVESFHIAVNGVADEPGSIPPRAMGSSTTSAPTQSPAWSTGLLDAIHWLSQTFLPGSLSSIRYASPQQESRRNAVGQQRLLPSERAGKTARQCSARCPLHRRTCVAMWWHRKFHREERRADQASDDGCMSGKR